MHTQLPLKNVWRCWSLLAPGNRMTRLPPRSTARTGRFANGGALGNARDAPVWLHRSADHRPSRSAQSYLRSVMPFSSSVAHPGWGADTILAELRTDPLWAEHPLPSRARIASFFKHAKLTRRDNRHTDLPEPGAPLIGTPHE